MSHTSRTLVAGLSAMVGLSIAASPKWQEVEVEPMWTPCGTTNATKAPRSKSSHKQNARKQRKARK